MVLRRMQCDVVVQKRRTGVNWQDAGNRIESLINGNDRVANLTKLMERIEWRVCECAVKSTSGIV